MILNLRREILRDGNRYEVLDQNQRIIYKAKGDIYSSEAKLYLYDIHDRELVFIHETKKRDRPYFEININNEHRGTLKREDTWKNSTYIIESSTGKFQVCQKFSGTDFEIIYEDTVFGTIKRDNRGRGGVHILTLNTEDNVEFFLAVLLAIITLNDHKDGFTI